MEKVITIYPRRRIMAVVNEIEEYDDDLSKTSSLGQELNIGEKLDSLENRAIWLDEEFRIPVIDYRIGVAPIVGLLPGAGDGLMMLIAATIVYNGMRLGAPTTTLIWMSIILVIEGIVGLIPGFGDGISIVWSSNMQNVSYLRAKEDSLDGSMNWMFLLILMSPFMMVIIVILGLL